MGNKTVIGIPYWWTNSWWWQSVGCCDD